jgi:hypothetical protein
MGGRERRAGMGSQERPQVSKKKEAGMLMCCVCQRDFAGVPADFTFPADPDNPWGYKGLLVLCRTCWQEGYCFKVENRLSTFLLVRPGSAADRPEITVPRARREARRAGFGRGIEERKRTNE